MPAQHHLTSGSIQGLGLTSASGTSGRAPGSFSTAFDSQASSTSSQKSPIRKTDTSQSSDDDSSTPSLPTAPRQQQHAQAHQSPTVLPSIYHANPSSTSLQNFSRPNMSHLRLDQSQRTGSPSTLSGKPAVGESGSSKIHARKHSHSQGFFEPSVPASSFLSPSLESGGGVAGSHSNLTASQIAAQAAMQHLGQHARQRSQTLPLDNNASTGQRKVSRGPVSPPLLSLTEASGERQSGFDGASRPIYHNGLLGGGTNAATTAANVAFPRSPQTSPNQSPAEFPPSSQRGAEKPAKPEKSSKVKLFSRPGKISTKDTKEKSMSSPAKSSAYNIGSLQRSNMSTNSLAESVLSSGSSMYSMANSSNATIRAIDQPADREKEKDKKHNFLSRQKHKLSSKDDHHLPLSSAASNSRPVDPSAPSSLYNFNLPPSPGPTSTSFAKSMSGLDLRHGGRALREKKQQEKTAAGSESNLRDSEMVHQGSSEWFGSSSLGTAVGTFPWTPGGTYSGFLQGIDVHHDLAKYGLNNMTPDDAWPFLKAKLLNIFEGEDLRLPVEDLNRLVSIHIQRCMQKRTPNVVMDDLRDLLSTGFSSIEQTLRRTPDDRLIPHLVELWLFTFTSVLPYMQAVFLPLDLEFSGRGPLMSAEVARDFWGALPVSHPPQTSSTSSVPVSQVLEVRRIVLTAYRDIVILPRFDTLKTIFSRLSLESINANLHNASDALSSSPSSSSGARPGTAMSLDPAHSSYSSQSTTLLGGTESSGARSRAISNVSYGSDHGPRSDGGSFMMPPPPIRPFTPSSTHPSSLGPGPGTNREPAAVPRQVNADESKHVTETVGRILQCTSVLVSVGVVAEAGAHGRALTSDEDAQSKMDELCKTLKLNWLGRGRTGRNRRGFIGTKVRKEQDKIKADRKWTEYHNLNEA
ncbi:MAG: hypothetical protein M1818_005827 [Claussenomyces sp. TS43310]|nr:MAG: hypothetical protein M1818_005827 [Claussenomyces sp. TS43310]